MQLFLLLATLLIGTTCYGQTFTLQVNNGYGSGTYQEGDTIHVWSNNVFGNTVFVNWTGSAVSYLNFDNEWHTTLVVPVGTNIPNLTLDANPGTLASTQVDSIEYILEGEQMGVISNVAKPVYYAVPAVPNGIVFLFHGTNGSGGSFFESYERYILIKDLVYNGFAVFTLDANERTMGDQNGDGSVRWNVANAGTTSAATNVDIRNVQALRDSIIRTFSLSSSIPSYTLGMSAGAVFSDICASALGFNASAHITAKGRTDTYTRSDIAPVIWIMSSNDNNQSADNTVAYSNYTTMLTSQVAEWHLLERSPVYRDRFRRSLDGITRLQADSVFQRLQNNGYLDTNNFLTTQDISTIPNNLWNNLGLNAIQKLEINQQLACVNAEHVLHSDYNKNIIRFFNQQQTISTVAKKEETKNLLLYPNPVQDYLQIQIEKESVASEIAIYTSNGEIVAWAREQSQVKVDLLKPGIYFVQVVLGNEIYWSKILKE